MLLSTVSLGARLAGGGGGGGGSSAAANSNINSRRERQPTSVFGFEVVRRLGSGAGSTIYAVRSGDGAGNEILALKHVVREDEKDIRFIEQLEAEHEVGHRVCHGSLRRTLDLRISRNLFRRATEAVLIMEFFGGEPLDCADALAIPPASAAGADASEAGRKLKLQQLLSVFVQTTRALDALHGMGYVHCDLKPANILLARTGRVMVIDLGQAARAGTIKPRIQGTPDYISPEQVRCQPVTPQTDVYNFGATMYWGLTGKNLPTLYTLKKDPNSFLLDVAIETPATLNPAVPEPLSNLVMQCVRTNAAKRPASAREVGQRLETISYGLSRRPASTTLPGQKAIVNAHLVPRGLKRTESAAPGR
jgi:serine/threonine-protein kinase